MRFLTSVRLPVRVRSALDERGQIVPLFALVLIALFAMAALLFDAAQTLTTRRRLQDAGDAAALAAAHTIQTGTQRTCSATNGPPPGAAKAAVVTAARNSIAANLPGYPAGNVIVTCPSGWNNVAVRVQLDTNPPLFFARLLRGNSPIAVRTFSTAVYGRIRPLGFSVLALNPGHPGWAQDGCPSLRFSGGPQITFEGNVMVNSNCAQAVAISGSSAPTLLNGSTISVTGGVNSSNLTLNPPPVTGVPPVPDPFADLPPIPTASLPIRSASQLRVSGANTVLQPGIYVGGIDLRSGGTALLVPGIYVLRGGGIQANANTALYTVPAGTTTMTNAAWAGTCLATNCGSLIYNQSTDGITSAGFQEVRFNGGSTIKMRGYLPEADVLGLNATSYRNMSFWQSGTPAPSASYTQPIMRLNGNTDVVFGGTVYTPGARVLATGTAVVVGGMGVPGPTFVSYELEFSGNATFQFRYRDSEAAARLDYGLVE